MLSKYYSLDECSNIELVLERLQSLQDDGRIYFSTIEQDVIKIKDSDLTVKETREILSFFEKNDVIEYLDYENIYEDEDDDEDDINEDEEYDF
jgi:hypothetical protein